MTTQVVEKSSFANLLGGMLLVSGCCIGAGMLALPILSGLAGFFPALGMLCISCAFMTFTGLLLVEINGSFCQSVNFLTMAEKTLGRKGKWICWISYLFLFYSLLVAYTAVSGPILSRVFTFSFGIALSSRAASLLFVSLLGSVIYLGTRWIDLTNRWFMLGLILSYCAMIGFGASKMELSYLSFAAPQNLFLSLPALVISFGFQNIIPSLSSYFDGDVSKVRLSILGGSFFTFIIYFIWIVFVLGMVSPQMIKETYFLGMDVSKALEAVLASQSVGFFAQCFAFFAIVTSFLAQGLSLVHFIGDGFKVARKKGREQGWLCLLALAPPTLFAIGNPAIFFRAIDFAGGICAVILFGIMPILMGWIHRYRNPLRSGYRVRGGRVALCFAFCFALLILLTESFRL